MPSSKCKAFGNAPVLAGRKRNPGNQREKVGTGVPRVKARRGLRTTCVEGVHQIKQYKH